MEGKVGDVGVDGCESAEEFVSDIICMRTSNSARRGMRAFRSFSGEVTRVVVYAIDDGSVASYVDC